jgi:hypothetical protein
MSTSPTFLTPVKKFVCFFLGIPALITFSLVGIGEAVYGGSDNIPIWVKVLIVIAALPMAIFFLLGPAIYSHLKRKKHRTVIAALNIVLLFAGAWPGMLFWIWALADKKEIIDPMSAAKPGKGPPRDGRLHFWN